MLINPVILPRNICHSPHTKTGMLFKKKEVSFLKGEPRLLTEAPSVRRRKVESHYCLQIKPLGTGFKQKKKPVSFAASAKDGNCCK